MATTEYIVLLEAPNGMPAEHHFDASKFDQAVDFARRHEGELYLHSFVNGTRTLLVTNA